MLVQESVGRKSSTVDTADWERAYREVKDILERRFEFDRVEEKRFLHHRDKGNVVSRIELMEELDKYTDLEVELVLTFDLEGDGNAAALTIDTDGKVVTRYPEESSWQRHPLYFALRSFWDKLVYGFVRGRWEDEAHETVLDIHAAIRGALKTVEE